MLERDPSAEHGIAPETVTHGLMPIAASSVADDSREAGATITSAIGNGRPQKITISSISQYLTRYKWRYFAVAFSSLCISLTEFLIPATFQIISDKVFANHSIYILNILMIVFIIVTLFGGLTEQFRNLIVNKISHALSFDLSSLFARHLLAMPIAFFEKIDATEVTSRIWSLMRVHRVLSNAIFYLWVDILFICASVAMSLYWSKTMGLIALLRIVLYLGGSLIGVRKFKRSIRKSSQINAEGGRLITDAVEGMETIKAQNAEDTFRDRIEQHLFQSSQSLGETFDVRSFIDRYSGLIDQLAIGALLWAGALAVVSGEVSAGEFIAVYLINRMLFRPMGRLTRALFDFQNFGVTIDDVNRFLEGATEPQGSALLRPERLEGSIRFDDVWFRYGKDENDTLKGVSFEIRPGEMVGIIGPPGSGKSTVLKLLQLFVHCSAGRITIDDIAIDSLDPRWLRRSSGVVPQECRLFNQSIVENIRLGYPAVAREAVVAAARFAEAHDFIVRFPRGYASIVGRGRPLSGGERQRIAIARAIVNRPRILLLDEPTSSLDYETETAVMRNLEAVFRETTVIIVGHRLSSLRRVDRIITLNAGRVVEDGTPGELIAKGGYFANLVSEQLNAFVSPTGKAADRVAVGQ